MPSDPYKDLPDDFNRLASSTYEQLASRLKAAKWLIEEIGVGNTFTQNKLRDKFPDISQIGRRMRELRPAGWQIDTNAENPDLDLEEHHFVKIGSLATPTRVSNRVRLEVFAADDFCCVVCGIGAGESYPDLDVGRAPTATAKLTLGHWAPQAQGGSITDRANLRTECARCNHAAQNITGRTATTESVSTRAAALPRRERELLAAWMRANRRVGGRAEGVWLDWRQLPPSERARVQHRLDQSD